MQGGTVCLVHSDHLARPIRITDAARATVWAATWGPWGEPHVLSGTLALDLRFPGQLFQIETGLHTNWHRHYDPVTGRYAQPDPLRFVDGPSVYAYVGASPYMATDREGKKTVSLGLYIEITPGLGFGSEGGFQIDFPWGDCTPWDLKVFGGISGRLGYAASLGGVLSGSNSPSTCGCDVVDEIFDGQMEGDFTGYVGPFGGTVTSPIVRGPDGSLDFDDGRGRLDSEIVSPKIKSRFGAGVGGSAGLGGSGTISIRGIASYIGSYF